MTIKNGLFKDITYSQEDVKNGRLCFVGSRVPVAMILQYLASGWSIKEVSESFPTVKPQYISKLLELMSRKFDSGHEQI